MPEFKNIGERIVWWLGEAGIYDNPIHVDAVIELCITKLDTSITHVRSTLSKNKKYFERSDDGMYSLSLTGATKYNKLKKGRQDVTTANLEHFVECYCQDQIVDVIQYGAPRIDIDFNELTKGSDIDFADDVLTDKTQYEILKDAIHEQADVWGNRNHHTEINITNLPEIIDVGDVQTAKVGNLICVRGRVLMQSPINTRAKRAAFVCQRCEQMMLIDQPRTSVIEPLFCDNEMCGKKGPFKYSEKDSELIDQQTIMLEPVEGQITMTVILQADLCEMPWIRDGKDLEVTGYLCVEPDFSKNGNGDHHRYLDAIGVKFTEDDIEITDEDRAVFAEWANDPADLRRRIIGTLAPDVIGRDDEKDALSLVFFSDLKWNQPLGSGGGRSSVHYLLIGDPGVSKSVLAKDVHRLALKSCFADAVNATAAGLGNAYMTIDGKPMLRGGVLAKADQGIAIIDEVDKLGNKDDIKKLGSVLEDQKQIVDKGGLNMTFPGRESIICTANPKYNRIDQYEAIFPQIDIENHILSRIDFIIVMRDIPDKRIDKAIVESIFNRERDAGNDAMRAIDIDTFKKFLKYMREIPAPTMTDEMQQSITKYYLDIRDTYQPDKEAPITGRSVTDLIRIATCVARREMATEITVKHAKYAVDLYERCLSTHNPDREIDFLGPTLALGRSARDDRWKVSEVEKIIRGYWSMFTQWPTLEQLSSEAEKHDISEIDLENIMLKLSQQGELLKKNGKVMLLQ